MRAGAAEELFVQYSLDDPYLRPHTQVVAEKVRRICEAEGVKPSLTRQALCLAWLHDIGKSEHLASTGFHPLDGANLLIIQGELQLAAMVCHHSGARYEAELRGITLPFACPGGAALSILDCADMTTLPSGESCSIEERGSDIARRHGLESFQHLAFRRFQPQLTQQAAQLGLS